METNKKYYYRYYVYAITGPGGFCDWDSHLSENYYDEDVCVNNLKSFNPHWQYIRAIRDKQIIKYDNETNEEISRYDC